MSRKQNNIILDNVQGRNHTDEEVLYDGLGLMTIEELKELPTHRLLSYFKKHVQRLPSLVSNWGYCDCCGERNVYDDRDIEKFRSWDIVAKIADRYKDEVKEILADREHIE